MKHTQTLFAMLLTAVSGVAQAQHILLVPTVKTGALNTPIDFIIAADGNIGGAVAWGSTLALSDPLRMTFTQHLGGATNPNPYISLAPFFDADYSDATGAIAGGNGTLNFNFLNTAPGSHYGSIGYAPLAEFEINLASGIGSDVTVTLGALGLPPNGTAIVDESGNNILFPIDPLRPTDNASTVHILVSGNAWTAALLPPAPLSAPEPAGWLTVAGGIAGGLCFPRRRRA